MDLKRSNGMSLLKDRIALVTGAGRHIGRGIAELLSKEGAAVVLTARTESQLQEVATKIETNGGTARVIVGDLRDDGFVEHLFATIEAEFQRLDILINNAGLIRFAKVEEMPVEDFRAVVDTNIVSVFACTQRAICLMKKRGDTGKILNIASVRSCWTEDGDAGAYNASKYGLLGMTESIARQLHGSGSNIAVGMICPGAVEASSPGARYLVPQTVAQAVLHALSAPANINVYQTVLFGMVQKPW